VKEPVEKIRNIGPKSMAWLRQTGVRTLVDLQAVGALAAFVRIKRAAASVHKGTHRLDGKLADAIIAAADEVLGGQHRAVAGLPGPSVHVRTRLAPGCRRKEKRHSCSNSGTRHERKQDRSASKSLILM